MFQAHFDQLNSARKATIQFAAIPHRWRVKPALGVSINKAKAKFKQEIDKCEPKHDRTGSRGSVNGRNTGSGIGKSGEIEQGNGGPLKGRFGGAE
jgi:hypothetical protein